MRSVLLRQRRCPPLPQSRELPLLQRQSRSCRVRDLRTTKGIANDLEASPRRLPPEITYRLEATTGEQLKQSVDFLLSAADAKFTQHGGQVLGVQWVGVGIRNLLLESRQLFEQKIEVLVNGRELAAKDLKLLPDCE